MAVVANEWVLWWKVKGKSLDFTQPEEDLH